MRSSALLSIHICIFISCIHLIRIISFHFYVAHYFIGDIYCVTKYVYFLSYTIMVVLVSIYWPLILCMYLFVISNLIGSSLILILTPFLSKAMPPLFQLSKHILYIRIFKVTVMEHWKLALITALLNVVRRYCTILFTCSPDRSIHSWCTSCLHSLVR